MHPNMATHDELESIWAEAESEIDRRGFALFPARLNPGEGAVGRWPEGAPIAEFLDLAERLGVTLVYAHASRLGPDDLEEFALRLSGSPGEGAETVLREAEEHIGDVWMTEVAFTHDGTSLLWRASAAWADELEQRAHEEEATAGVLREAEAETKETEWVRTLAKSLEFESAKSFEQRLRIARRLIPELEQLRNYLDPRTRNTANRVVQAAWDLYETEMRPEQERSIARQARKMLDAGQPKHEVAGGFVMGVNKLNRILGQYVD